MRVHVVRRGDTGTYRVKLRAKDETGRWITRWEKGSYRTEQEAIARKQELERNAATGNITTLDGSTVAGYLQDWLDLRLSMGKIEASTHWSYRVLFKRINRFLGDRALATLSSKEIQAAYGKMVAEYGASAAHGTHVIFKVAIMDAVRSGRLLADPFVRVEPPRAKKVRKQTTLTAEQVADFVALHKGTELGRLIELLAVSGMRVGEACALQWRDFDFTRNTIHIQRNLATLENGTVYVKSPKTEAGVRVVSIAPETMAVFQPHAGKPNSFVFGGKQSRLWAKRIIDAMARAGLGQFTTHDLRHAHATFLLKQVPNPKLVSKRLGHSDVKITLGIYAHVMDGDDEELAGLAAGLVRKANTL